MLAEYDEDLQRSTSLARKKGDENAVVDNDIHKVDEMVRALDKGKSFPPAMLPPLVKDTLPPFTRPPLLSTTF